MLDLIHILEFKMDIRVLHISRDMRICFVFQTKEVTLILYFIVLHYIEFVLF